MICDITIEQQDKLYVSVKVRLNNLGKSGDPFDPKAIIRSIYDLVHKKTGNKEQALAYARLVPSKMMDAVLFDVPLRRSLKGLSLDAINDIQAAFEESIDNVAKILELNNLGVKELEKIQEQVDYEKILAPGRILPVHKMYAQQVSFLATTGNEKKVNDIKDSDPVLYHRLKFYYNVQRKILKQVFETPEKTGASINYPGVGPVYLKMISVGRLPLDQRAPDYDYRGDETVLMLVDSKGNPVYIDSSDPDLKASDTGLIPYWHVRDTKNITGEHVNNMIDAYAKYHGIDDKVYARQAVKQQYEILQEMEKHIAKNPKENEVVMDIIGGHYGYSPNLKYSERGDTPKDIVTEQQTFKQAGFDESNMNPVGETRKGDVHFYVRNPVSGQIQEIFISKGIPKTHEKTINTILELLYRPVVDSDGRELSLEEKQEEITKLIMLPQIEPSEEAMREKLLKELRYHLRKDLLNNADNFSIPIIENGIIRQEPVNYKTWILKNKAFFLRKLLTADYENSSFSIKPAEYGVTKGDPFVSSSNAMPVMFDTTTGPQVSYMKVISYNRDGAKTEVYLNVISNNYQYKLVMDGDKVVEVWNRSYKDNWSQRTGSVVSINNQQLEDIIKALPPAAPPIPEVPPTEPGDSLSEPGPADNNIDDYIKRKFGLSKLDSQESVTATEKQIIEAEAWYNNHPMKKDVPFETMFNAVNTGKPDSVAHWTTNGIILYQGADFSDLYHEAWHGFSQTFLTKEDRQKLYTEMRKKSGSFKDFQGRYVTYEKASSLQLEEKMAEDFREYVLAKGTKVEKAAPVKASIFRKLWNLLKKLFGKGDYHGQILNPKLTPTVAQLYEKMRIGDLTGFSFNANNADFGNLYQRIAPTGPSDAHLTYQSSKKIIDAIDSFLSLSIDATNKFRATNISTVGLFKTDQQKLAGYAHFKEYLQEVILPQLHEKIDKAQDPQAKNLIQNDIDLVGWTLNNFGDMTSIKKNVDMATGVIYSHLQESRHITSEERDELMLDNLSEEGGFLNSRKGWDRKGNENSLQELSTPDVMRLINSLFEFHPERKTDQDGNKYFSHETTPWGLPKLSDFNKTWNDIARKLEGILDPSAMAEKIDKLAETNGLMWQLQSKLGPIGTESTNDLWTNFWQSFNKTRIQLQQVNINGTSETEFSPEFQRDIKTDVVNYDLTVGKSSAAYRAVGMKWEALFRLGSDYVSDQYQRNKNNLITKITPVLDVKRVLQNYKLENVYYTEKNREKFDPQKAINFLRAIGVRLTDNKPIRDEIKNETRIRQAILDVYNKLQDMNTAKTPITSLRDLFKDDLNKRYNDLQNLEASLGDTVSNFMVVNAEGEAQFEHSLNSTLTRMTYAMNSANSFAELISMPSMSHLDPRRNPWTKDSKLLRSLFEYNPENVIPYGNKRVINGDPVEVKIINLSGIQNRLDDFTLDGISTLNSDYYGKAISDFHLMMLAGTPELMRHADKSTSLAIYTTWVDKGAVEKDASKHLYIDTLKFLKPGIKEVTYNAIMPYVDAELERMWRMKNEEMDEFDFNYKKTGSQFVVFHDVFSPETKERLTTLKDEIMKVDSKITVAQFIKDNDLILFDKVTEELRRYFTEQNNQVRKSITTYKFISPRLTGELRSRAGKAGIRGRNDKAPTTANLEEALIQSYTMNSWIHNMETMNIFYGDLAQYGDFHKRIPGISSTGDILRTDDYAIRQINKDVRGYAQSIMPEVTRTMQDATFNTGVMHDVSNQAMYFDDMEKALRNFFQGRYGGQGKAVVDDKVAKAMKAYRGGEMKEGDGQGWITFDSYRIMLKLLGKWSEDQEKLYWKIVNKKPITEDVTEFFPVKKMQYWGVLKTNGIPVNAMHKFSLMPLIPNVIEGRNLEKLHNKMVEEKIDYAMFKSASKVGNLGRQELVTEENPEGINPFYSNSAQRTLSETPFTKNIIFLEYLKDVLETNSKYKKQITVPTQARKLIIDGLVTNGLPVDFMPSEAFETREAAWNKLSEVQKVKKSPAYKKYSEYEDIIKRLTQIKYKELIHEIGWKLVDGKLEGDVRDLKRFVIKQLKNRDIADHEIAFLGKEGEGFPYDLSYSLSSDKIEKLLNSIVVKRLIRQKINGEALVQVATSGFEPQFRGATDEEKQKYDDSTLKFYSSDGGKTKAMQIKIALQGRFKNLLYHEDVVSRAKDKNITPLQALNELIKDPTWLSNETNRKMITMIGIRIPTQGLNSMDFMEVAEFLPENAGNIIIGPSEIVGKSGSDFDIDKLFTIMPNLEVIRGKLKYILPSKTPKETLEELEMLTQADEKRKTDIYEKYKPAIEALRADPEQKAAGKKYETEMNLRLEDLNTKILALETLFISYLKGRVDYERAGAVENNLYDARLERDQIYSAYDDMIDSYANKKELAPIKEARAAELDPILDRLDVYKEKMIALGSKAVENELITSMHGILSAPENFVNIIRPNGTDIYNDIADDLRDDVVDYDEKAYVYPENAIKDKNGKIKPSPTRTLEIGFNLHKQQTMSRGKSVLGIGAKNNTYNVLFNRSGMYMNPTVGMTMVDFETKLAEFRAANPISKKAKKIRNEIKNFARQTLLLPHNTLEVNGEKAISLSHGDDVEGLNRISDVISQMINGWVDVAKEDKIFYIQGNRELTPSLLFLTQAGVPLETAVYFLSQPLIQEYVRKQMLKKSTFASVFGVAPATPNKFRYEAKLDMLSEPRYGINMEEGEPFGDNPFRWMDKLNILTETLRRTDDYKGGFDKDKLHARIKDASKDKENIEYTDFDRAILMHFFEIEEMAKSIAKISRTTDVDTDKSNTLFEAQQKHLAILDLLNDPRLPQEPVKRIFKESAISSMFDVLQYQQDIWKDFFRLRDHDSLNSYLIDRFREGISDEIAMTFDDPEKFANEFRNEFMVFLMENELYHFEFSDKSYKGYPMAPETPTEEVPYLPYGVIVKDGTLYYDKKSLENHWSWIQSTSESKPFRLTASGTVDGKDISFSMAGVHKGMFARAENYYQYAFEKERLRDIYPHSVLKDSYIYKAFHERFKKEYPTLSDTRLEEGSYEHTLKDLAMTNVFNIPYLFKYSAANRNTYADKIIYLGEKFKELKENYDVMNAFQPRKNATISNLIIPGSKGLTAEEINIYHENLEELSDPDKIKINASRLDKELIADLFSKMSFYSVIQSGYNTSTENSIQRVTPQEKFLEFMEGVGRKYVGKKIPEQVMDTYFNKFVSLNRNAYLSGKYKDYNMNAKLVEYTDEGEEVTIGATVPIVEPAKVIDYKNFEEAKKAYRSGYGIWTMRPNSDVRLDPNRHFGNPWSPPKDRLTPGTIVVPEGQAVLNYEAWLRGVDHFDVQPERREWIQSQIASKAMLGRTLIYYKPSNYRSHADVLAELINEQAPTEDQQEIKPIPEDLYGNPVFDQAMTVAGAQQMLKQHPNAVLVINDKVFVEGKETTSTFFDWKFKGIQKTNPESIATIQTTKGFSTTYQSAAIMDKNGDINPLYKDIIDSDIANLLRLKAEGKQLVFNSSGYGQVLIDATNPKSTPKLGAIKTFGYLSQELMRNFGFLNPNYLKLVPTASAVIQEGQAITDEDVINKLLICFTK